MPTRHERVLQRRRRRSGASRLTAQARQAMHRFATQALLRPAAVAKVRQPPLLQQSLGREALDSFVEWRRHHACASERDFARCPNIAHAVAVLGKVEHSKMLWVALCFWRVDNFDVWSEIEDSLLMERWSQVELAAAESWVDAELCASDLCERMRRCARA